MHAAFNVFCGSYGFNTEVVFLRRDFFLVLSVNVAAH